LLINHGIPEDIHCIIEAKVQLLYESSNSFISLMPRIGKNTFGKKCHAKRLKIYNKSAKWTSNA
jgi:hypothetical protein